MYFGIVWMLKQVHRGVDPIPPGREKHMWMTLKLLHLMQGNWRCLHMSGAPLSSIEWERIRKNRLDQSDLPLVKR